MRRARPGNSRLLVRGDEFPGSAVHAGRLFFCAANAPRETHKAFHLRLNLYILQFLLRHHRDEFRVLCVTSGIKVLKRMAYGYRDMEFFKLRILYFILIYKNFYLITHQIQLILRACTASVEF
jgi:hypothetical protein